MEENQGGVIVKISSLIEALSTHLKFYGEDREVRIQIDEPGVFRDKIHTATKPLVVTVDTNTNECVIASLKDLGSK